MSTEQEDDVVIVEREPTIVEIQQALAMAKEQGLPEQFDVQWDEAGRKLWVLDHKKFYSIPRALAHAVQVGLLPPTKMPESYQDKELSPEELEATLREARQQGLPESFACRWDNAKRRRVWYTPDGRRIKGGIPAALKTAADLGLISNDHVPMDKSRLTLNQKIRMGLQEARSHGLEGWSVSWDSKYNQKVFCSPDGARKLYGLDKALAYAVKQKWLPANKLPPQFAKDRELTEEEKAKAWTAAKKKNLPETWTVVWDSKQHRRAWVAPDNRRCDCIAKAIAYSVQKGWLEPSKVTKPPKTSLTLAEERAALIEARERGLPACFAVRWNPKKNQKQWIAPIGRVCNSVPAALAYATKHGLLDGPVVPITKPRKRKQTRIISPRPLKQAALTQLVDAALADDRQELVQQQQQQQQQEEAETAAATCEQEDDVVVDGDGGHFGWTRFQGDDDGDDDGDDNGTEMDDGTKPINSELAQETANGILETEEAGGKTSMSQHEEDKAMEQAKLRGLPDGWMVSWDVKRKRRIWVSACGKYKCRGIPSALQKSLELGLISDTTTPAQESSHLVSTGARTATAMRDAKHRGLPDSWTLEFLDDGRRSLRWRSPDGRVAKTLVEALKMSVEMGILSRDKMPVEYRERTLSAKEEERYLMEAASRGLPPGWSVTWNSRRRQKIWISPDRKTKCDSINKALKVSVRLGLLSQEDLPATLQARKLTQEEIDTALEDARAKGLTCNGWRIEWNAQKGCRRWTSPDNKRRCECISKAVAYSKKMGWIPADS